ncbi:hypothetical protein ACQP2U_42555 (plasmid) [Nocardia sp. CA-084685]|uniref:hypothetical protein n=1 Tax=Nocardia sp. CA-084685 TaxID=3239970 RepID=UPI003D979E3E
MPRNRLAEGSVPRQLAGDPYAVPLKVLGNGIQPANPQRLALADGAEHDLAALIPA